MKIKKRTVVISSCLLAAAIMTISMRFANPQGFLIANSANDSHTVWGHYNRLEPTLDTPGCQEFWISCDDHEIKYVAPTTGVIQDRGTPTVAQVEEWKAKELYQDRRYLPKWRIDETHISFGSYPTTKITDKATTDVLISKLSVSTPTVDDHAGWEVYDNYYAQGSAITNCFYQDIFVNGNLYRSIFLRSYRPKATLNNSADAGHSDVDENGYSTGHLFFFKYESIVWNVAEENEDYIKMYSSQILDSNQYCKDQSTTGKYTGQANCYEDSDLRTFLNENFYDLAFNINEKNTLVTMDVDNSKASTDLTDTYASYACRNTNDKVTVMSYAEANSLETADRTLTSTDYALSQGNLSGYWVLRSPANQSGSEGGIRYKCVTPAGAFGTQKVIFINRGIVPVVTLSK